MTPSDLPPECRAVLSDLVASGAAFARWPQLEAAGHARQALAELWLAGWVDTLESDGEGFKFSRGAWVTFTPAGAAAWGVALVEFEDERPRWTSEPEPATLVVAEDPRKVPIHEFPGWVEDVAWRMGVKRRAEEQRAQELLRQAEKTDYLIDPRTGEPVMLWGARVGKKVVRARGGNGALKGGVG